MNGAKLHFENWHAWVQVVAFTIIFLAFCYFSVRALLMKKDREQKMAAMPLQDEPDNPANTDTKTPRS